MTNHFQTVHGLSQEAAEIKTVEVDVQAMKDEIMGEGFKGTIYIVLLDLETTGLIKRESPMPAIVEIAVSAEEIHHINNTMVAAAPTFDHAGQLFVDWVASFSCPQDIVLFLCQTTGGLLALCSCTNARFQNSQKVASLTA